MSKLLKKAWWLTQKHARNCGFLPMIENFVPVERRVVLATDVGVPVAETPFQSEGGRGRHAQTVPPSTPATVFIILHA